MVFYPLVFLLIRKRIKHKYTTKTRNQCKEIRFVIQWRRWIEMQIFWRGEDNCRTGICLQLSLCHLHIDKGRSFLSRCKDKLRQSWLWIESGSLTVRGQPFNGSLLFLGTAFGSHLHLSCAAIFWLICLGECRVLMSLITSDIIEIYT